MLDMIHIESALNSIVLPQSLLNCQDVHCEDPSHSDDADTVIVNILECVEKTAFEVSLFLFRQKLCQKIRYLVGLQKLLLIVIWHISGIKFGYQPIGQ